MPVASIDTSCKAGTFTLEAYYLNFIARQLYVQNNPNSKKLQY